MKTISTKTIVISIIVSVILFACKERKEKVDVEEKTELFTIYVGKDTFLEERNVYEMLPHKDRTIAVNKNKTVKEKVETITDTLSKSYFNKLDIEVSEIYTSDPAGKIANISLKEDSAFTGPGSLPPYQSWYDYFQGSYGGQNTTILLKENILQREYNGDWIDGVVFFYQGDSIGVWDHINLNGLIKKSP